MDALSPSETFNVSLFVRETIRTARSLPFAESLQFLHGALLVGGEHEAMEPLREFYQHVTAAEAQLQLSLSR